MLLATMGDGTQYFGFCGRWWPRLIYRVCADRAGAEEYIGSKEMREEKQAVGSAPLGETLKAHRTRCQMTQEFRG